MSSAVPNQHHAETGTYSRICTFDLQLPPGSYNVKVTALGTENLSQLGVGKAEGSPKLTVEDLNNDGVDEYRWKTTVFA